jgi:hypothetical protein
MVSVINDNVSEIGFSKSGFSACGHWNLCNMGKNKCYYEDINPEVKTLCHCYGRNHAVKESGEELEVNQEKLVKEENSDIKENKIEEISTSEKQLSKIENVIKTDEQIHTQKVIFAEQGQFLIGVCQKKFIDFNIGQFVVLGPTRLNIGTHFYAYDIKKEFRGCFKQSDFSITNEKGSLESLIEIISKKNKTTKIENKEEENQSKPYEQLVFEL